MSITIDALARDQQLTDSDRLVIKLDVEGQEVAALKGARQVLKRDTLIIYEDHGQDRSHATTRYVFEALGLPVFSLAADGSVTRVSDLGTLDRLKVNPKIGYNFATCPPGSGFHRWISGIASHA